MAVQTDEKIKHLEFIQNVVARMSSNSFLIKGWTVTLVAGIFALANKDAMSDFIIIAYFPIPVFWYLDAFFLSHERKYRALYDVVRSNKEPTEFDMSTKNFRTIEYAVVTAVFSKTLLIFYLALLTLTTIININIYMFDVG